MLLEEFKDMMKDLGLISIMQNGGLEFYLEGMASIGYLVKLWNVHVELPQYFQMEDSTLVNIWDFRIKKNKKNKSVLYIEPDDIAYSERLAKIDKKTVFQKITKTLAEIKDFKKQIRKELIKSI